jgi:cellulose synthase (UDP-forming)
VSETETHLAIDFVNMTQAQKDNLVLVIYSDVQEWYSQKREYADNPFASLGFLATSLTRSLRELKVTERKKIRKQVQAYGQIYWNGHFFPGVATELGVTGLKLQLESKKAVSANKYLGEQDFQTMRNIKPLVGLMLSEEANSTNPSKFVAEITNVEEGANGSITVELNFPDKFKPRQDNKIKQLLQVL